MISARPALVLGTVVPLLAACAVPRAAAPTTPPADVAAPGDAGPANDTCGAARVARHLGQIATPGLRASITRDSGAAIVRWLPPGSVVTMDYRPDRLNVDLDADNRITRFNCT